MKNFVEQAVDNVFCTLAKLPSWFDGTLTILLIVALLLYPLAVQLACMDTILPKCLSWIHYMEFLLYFYGIGNLIFLNILRKLNCQTHIVKCWLDYLLAAFLLVPGIIFIPNRYTSIGKQQVSRGTIVKLSSWQLPSKTTNGSNISCAKIMTADGKRFFWHNCHDEAIGTKCIIKSNRGIFGLRYVQDVDFIVE